jgi:hypothetical protein
MRTICIIAVMAAVGLMCGCDEKPAPLPDGSVTSDAVHDAERQREFIKVWRYQVTPEVEMRATSTLKPWLSKCDKWSCDHFAVQFDDELRQRDGAWVYFDCDKVAEKIIDRDLVSKVETACAAIHATHATARDYWIANNDPSEFTDSNGRIWKRQ